ARILDSISNVLLQFGLFNPTMKQKGASSMSRAASDLVDVLNAIPQGAESAFPKPEYDRRIRQVQDAIGRKGFDLLLLSGPENIFYLTGQQTPGYYTFQCLCIPASGEPFHVLRSLEAMNCRLNSYIADVTGYADDENPAVALANQLKSRGWSGKKVAIDQSG